MKIKPGKEKAIKKGSVLVNIVQEIAANQIREESDNGTDYVVITSFTMPDDVVLNRILYSEEQITRTINTIDGSPAPVDHPVIDGRFVSAYEAQAALEFGLGVNKYISKEGNRHKIEKWFNKELLQNTDRGRRLQSAINKGEPIHSSTGVVLTTIEQSGSNQYGEYDAVANISHFDHDAALPDSIGAGTPEDTGTGIYVNKEGGKEEFEVMFVNITDNEPRMLEKLAAKVASLLGISQKPKTNSEEADMFKEEMIQALNGAGIKTEGLEDVKLFAEYNKLIAVNAAKAVEAPKVVTAEEIAAIVTNTLDAREAKAVKDAKAGIVGQVIANTANEYTLEDSEMLLNTDERILKSFLPKKVAANLLPGEGFEVNTKESDHVIDLNELAGVK